MTNFFHLAVEISQLIKLKTDTRIIWGGVHPQVAAEECFEYADWVYVGETDNRHYIDFLLDPYQSYPYVVNKTDYYNGKIEKKYILTPNLDELY